MFQHIISYIVRHLIRSEKLQNESFPNFSNFYPEFCPEFCSEFSPNILRSFRASFRGRRWPEKIHQKSLPFFNAKFPGKFEEKIHKNFLESGQSNTRQTKIVQRRVCSADSNGQVEGWRWDGRVCRCPDLAFTMIRIKIGSEGNANLWLKLCVSMIGNPIAFKGPESRPRKAFVYECLIRAETKG